VLKEKTKNEKNGCPCFFYQNWDLWAKKYVILAVICVNSEF